MSRIRISPASDQTAKVANAEPRRHCIKRLAGCLLLILAPALLALSDQKQDYLTDDEVEQLREAQDPAERMKLLDDFLKERLQKARILKSPGSSSGVEGKTGAGKDKAPVVKPAKSEPTTPSGTVTQKTAPKSFVVLMGEYLQCLEEISSNVENFSSFKVEPKTYLKSLKGLDQSLQEHRKWIAEISGKLDRSEKGVVTEVSETLEELSADVNTEIRKANEEMKLLKESKKSKSDQR